MFTGLIEGQGKIANITKNKQSLEMSIHTPKEVLIGYKVGDSMAINGTCLTATRITDDLIFVDVMPETFKKTTFHLLSKGEAVHLERAMAATSRFEGHLVAGHIDTTVRLIKKQAKENAVVLSFNYPPELQGEIIAQGSIAINGVSLTVSSVTAQSFSVSLIPHSIKKTTLEQLKQGELVNIETDMIAKYLKQQRK